MIILFEFYVSDCLVSSPVQHGHEIQRNKSVKLITLKNHRQNLF